MNDKVFNVSTKFAYLCLVVTLSVDETDTLFHYEDVSSCCILWVFFIALVSFSQHSFSYSI